MTGDRRAPGGGRASRRKGIVVAIDGPAGAGKTTVARGVAQALGYAHLDTGAMYRALTAKVLEQGIDPSDPHATGDLATRTSMELGEDGSIVVDGRPTGREIRSQQVNRAVSVVSAHSAVRHELVRLQREILRGGGVVAEGRDIGTVVYPSAPVKVFLTASAEERARRRHAEVVAAGEDVAFESLRRELERRDALDSTRTVSPLAPAGDAVVLESTGKTPGEVIDEIVALVRRAEGERAQPRRGGGAATGRSGRRERQSG